MLAMKGKEGGGGMSPIIIMKVKVIGAENVSGVEIPYLKKSYDIGVKLMLDIGREFKPTLVIAGNFKKDESKKNVTGWGSAFVVRDLFGKIGYEGTLGDDNKLPQEALDFLIDKEFLRLSYVSGTKENGKFRYSDWSQVAAVDEGEDVLYKRFIASHAKGYPSNYHPELLEADTFPPEEL